MTRSASYDPDGSGERALTVLADGACRADELPLLIFTHSAIESRAKKVRFLIRRLVQDGLVQRHDAGWLAITRAGREVLADLRAGYGGELAGTSVRVFVERRAAA